MKSINDNDSLKEVRMTANVPVDGSVEVHQFTTWRKYLTNWSDGYLRIGCKALILIMESDITARQLKVLSGLLKHCEWENIVTVSQSVIAKELGSQQTHISKDIKKLISLGFLRIIATDGRKNIYMLNPELFLRSKAKNLKTLIDKWYDTSIDKTIDFGYFQTQKENETRESNNSEE